VVKVLFVCMGNICRSPTAEGVFRKLVRERGLDKVIEIDSAGTHGYHVGRPPDARAQEAARQRGVDLGALQGRQVTRDDFERFDYILAMDNENIESLLEICPMTHRPKLRLLLDYAPHRTERQVPDPYFGGAAGFERVLDLIEDAAEGLLDDIDRRVSTAGLQK